MSPLTKQHVVQRMGELDDLDVARLLATSASLEEFDEAMGLVELEDELGEAGPPASSPRVQLLREVIEEILLPDMLEEPYPPVLER